MYRTLLLCLASGLSLCTSAIAERTCRILFLKGAANAPESLILFDGTGSQEVELPRLNMSPVYKLPEGPLVLRLMEQAPENPEEIPAGIPQAKVAETVGDIYLLVTNDPKNKVLPVSMQVINANQGSFRKGQMMWFNLTTYRVGGQLGSEKLALEPNSRKISRAPADGEVNYPVELFYQMPGDEKIRPLVRSNWLHYPADKTVLFVLKEEGSRMPRIMGFSDFRLEEEKEKAETEAGG